MSFCATAIVAANRAVNDPINAMNRKAPPSSTAAISGKRRMIK
jgi:hypothetical protein